MAEYFGKDLVLLERIAVGGGGEIFRGLMLGVGGFRKHVAIKRMLPSFSTDETMRRMFERELLICGKLQHPNIVTVFRSGLRGGYLYIVMEDIRGKDLFQLIQTANTLDLAIPENVASFIMFEAVKGLSFAHSFRDERTQEPLNIVHRDISPQNLMVSYSGNVKIVDFGIAKAADQARLTTQGDLKGRVAYMAPELFAGEPPDQRSDMFALGVVLYELLTQRQLFAADSMYQELELVKKCEVPSFNDIDVVIDPELEAIVRKLIVADPAERFQSSNELLRAFATFHNRKYPEFTYRECAAFLERLFGDEIEQERRRLDASEEIQNLEDVLCGDSGTWSNADSASLNEDADESRVFYEDDEAARRKSIHESGVVVENVSREQESGWLRRFRYGAIVLLSLSALVLGGLVVKKVLEGSSHSSVSSASTAAVGSGSYSASQGYITSSVPNTLTPEEQEKGYVLLFNGRDLNGWWEVGKSGSFTVLRGAILGKRGKIRQGGTTSYLLSTDQKYDDFVLRLQFWMNRLSNSGVFFRIPHFRGRTSSQGMEVQLLEYKELRPKEATGAIYGVVRPLLETHVVEAFWHDLEISCKGERIRVKIDGNVVQDIKQNEYPALDKRPRRGFIALSSHVGRSVMFRTLRLRTLGPDDDID